MVSVVYPRRDVPDEGRIRSGLRCGRACPCNRPNGKVHCPRHDATAQGNPDLDVKSSGETVLVRCRVCGDEGQSELIPALQDRDLWPRGGDLVPFRASRSERYPSGPAVQVVSSTVYEIKDAAGTIVARHTRSDLANGKKSMAWRQPDGRLGLGGRPLKSLPLFGGELLGAVADGATVLVCEGEKAALAVRDLGLVAVATVCGAATVPDDDVLAPLVRYDAVVWPDHDDEGRKHMRSLAERLTALGGRIRCLAWGEQDKDDAADFVERGGTARQLVELVAEAASVDPNAEALAALPIVNAVDLAAMQFVAPKTIVPHLLVEGATIVVAPGKSGKSRLMMGVAVAVAHGGVALGSLEVEGGDVLYLALEDGRRRGQSRMLAACGGGLAPARLDLAFEWQTMDKGGLDQIEAWLKSRPHARLVIVDTLKRFRARTDGHRNAYDEDYEALAPLNDLALRYGVCIAIVHHTNKIKLSDDPTDRASGSTGMLAAVDGMIVMERTRGKADAALHVFHRDLEDGKYAIKADQAVGWHFLGDAEDFARTETQDEIVDAILAGDIPLKPTDVAAALGRDRKAVGQRMWQLTRPDASGLQILVSRGGYYWPASRPWPTLTDDEDEAPLRTEDNRARERERVVPVSPVLPWGDEEVAGSEISVTGVTGAPDVMVVTGVTGGEDMDSHSLEATLWKECESGNPVPVTPVTPVPGAPARDDARMVTPPSGSNSAPARAENSSRISDRPVWRCPECRALEYRVLPDGRRRCLGFGHISMMGGGP